MGYSEGQTEFFEVDFPVGYDYDDCGGGITKIKFTWRGFELWLSDKDLKAIQYGSYAALLISYIVPEIGAILAIVPGSISGGIQLFRENNRDGIIIYYEWGGTIPLDLIVVAQSPQ